jgi:hypothetical protein
MSQATLTPRLSLASVGAIALVIALGGAARADVISTVSNTSFATNPVSISLGSGSFTFTGIPNTFIGNPPAEVSTSGSAEVSSFLGGVTDFSSGASIDQTGELYGFSAFSTPSVIPNSAARDFIGLSFTNGSGLHYGYAQVDGTQLISYAYESLPNTTITTGATSVPVPEPPATALLLTGLIGLASVRRRRPATLGNALVPAR